MPGVSSTTVGFCDFCRALGRDRFQSLEEFARIIVHRADMQPFENLGEGALHQIAVLQHIGDAGWHAQVVFEHVDLAVAVADQIGSRDVAPHAPRRVDADALRTVEGRRANDFLRNDFILQNLLVVIDVVNEFVERVDALLESAFDAVPLFAAHNAWDQVEWKDSLGSG